MTSADGCRAMAEKLRALAALAVGRGLHERAAELAGDAALFDARGKAWASADFRLTDAARRGFLVASEDVATLRTLRDMARAAATDLRAAQDGGAGPWDDARETELRRWARTEAPATAEAPVRWSATPGIDSVSGSEGACDCGACGEGSPSKPSGVEAA